MSAEPVPRADTFDPFEVVYDGVPLATVEDTRLALIPRGGTPLLEAVGRTLAHVAERLGRQESPPGLVIVMVITDGQENSSKHDWTKARVKALIGAARAALPHQPNSRRNYRRCAHDPRGPRPIWTP